MPRGSAGIECVVVNALADQDAISNTEVSGQCDGGWSKAGEQSAWCVLAWFATHDGSSH